MTAPIRILAICVHNSARSQMAEWYLNQFGEGRLVVESAGLEPGVINPLVIEVMREEGVDLSGKPTNGVFDFYRQGRLYDYVLTVCTAEQEARCPLFPGVVRRLHWDLEDPSRVTGSHEEKLEKVRRVRDDICGRARTLAADLLAGKAAGRVQADAGKASL